jgi:hypothetical protein
MTKKKSKGLRIGDTVEVPFHLSSVTLWVPCVVLDTRTHFGRVEWELSPVGGRGDAWITEDKIISGTGPSMYSKQWQENHNKPKKQSAKAK